MAKTLAECSADESLRYIQCYFATVDTLTDAQSKLELLAQIATTAVARSTFRAKAMEIGRDLELLKNERRAFLTTGAGIDPPTLDLVAQVQSLTASLAVIVTQETEATAIIKITTDALEAFQRLNV